MHYFAFPIIRRQFTQNASLKNIKIHYDIENQRIASLRTAIQEGLTSGCVEDFDSKTYLQEMKARKKCHKSISS